MNDTLILAEEIDMGSAAEKENEHLKVNEAKWTKTLMDAGWTALPSVILERQRALDLDAIDVNIILHLAKHWWEKDRLPFPSKKALAECMNVSEATIQRRIRAMEKCGYIRREARFHGKHKGQKQNAYDLSGLIASVTPYAEEALADRTNHRKEAAERRTRKRLRIVRPDDQAGG